jgi:SagB-type dehydrogenase family enzyme
VTIVLFRRLETLVCYWESGGFTVRDYAVNRRWTLSLISFGVLFQLDSWTDFKALAAALPDYTAAVLRRELRRLRAMKLVETSDDPPRPASLDAGRWMTWSPDAALLHFGTKNVTGLSLRASHQAFADRLEIDPYPETIKTMPGAPRRSLPDYPRTGSLPRVLLARRTWRRFAPEGVSLQDVATLLGLTWGVQRWLDISPSVRPALKTSPSGGACHSIEVYLVAANVKKLPRGIYHYRPDSHELEVVRRGLRKDVMRHYLRQPWFAGCPALFVMTSVFSRMRWKYSSPRAYRVLLMEAGHLCQTFCLVATWLGLAPFSTAAFADSVIERQLGIDGVEEGVLYAAGVGARPGPAAADPRAPFPERPATLRPSHLLRRQRHGKRV